MRFPQFSTFSLFFFRFPFFSCCFLVLILLGKSSSFPSPSLLFWPTNKEPSFELWIVTPSPASVPVSILIFTVTWRPMWHQLNSNQVKSTSSGGAGRETLEQHPQFLRRDFDIFGHCRCHKSSQSDHLNLSGCCRVGKSAAGRNRGRKLIGSTTPFHKWKSFNPEVS